MLPKNKMLGIFVYSPWRGTFEEELLYLSSCHFENDLEAWKCQKHWFLELKIKLKILNWKSVFYFLTLSFNVLLQKNYFDNMLLFTNTETKGIKYFGVL